MFPEWTTATDYVNQHFQHWRNLKYHLKRIEKILTAKEYHIFKQELIAITRAVKAQQLIELKYRTDVLIERVYHKRLES